MFDFINPDTVWLTVTNILLGLATISCVVLALGAAVREIIARLRHNLAVTRLSRTLIRSHSHKLLGNHGY